MAGTKKKRQKQLLPAAQVTSLLNSLPLAVLHVAQVTSLLNSLPLAVLHVAQTISSKIQRICSKKKILGAYFRKSNITIAFSEICFRHIRRKK